MTNGSISHEDIQGGRQEQGAGREKYLLPENGTDDSLNSSFLFRKIEIFIQRRVPLGELSQNAHLCNQHPGPEAEY